MFNRVAAKSSKESENGPKDGAETTSDISAAAALPTAPPLAAPQASRRIGLCYFFSNRLKALSRLLIVEPRTADQVADLAVGCGGCTSNLVVARGGVQLIYSGFGGVYGNLSEKKSRRPFGPPRGGCT